MRTRASSLLIPKLKADSAWHPVPSPSIRIKARHSRTATKEESQDAAQSLSTNQARRLLAPNKETPLTPQATTCSDEEPAHTGLALAGVDTKGLERNAGVLGRVVAAAGLLGQLAELRLVGTGVWNQAGESAYKSPH